MLYYIFFADFAEYIYNHKLYSATNQNSSFVPWLGILTSTVRILRIPSRSTSEVKFIKVRSARQGNQISPGFCPDTCTIQIAPSIARTLDLRSPVGIPATQIAPGVTHTNDLWSRSPKSRLHRRLAVPNGYPCYLDCLKSRPRHRLVIRMDIPAIQIAPSVARTIDSSSPIDIPAIQIAPRVALQSGQNPNALSDSQDPPLSPDRRKAKIDLLIAFLQLPLDL